MAEVREVTLRMSARLVSKLERLADQAHESPETFIESRLAEFVRFATQQRLRGSSEHELQVDQTETGYL
jgi:hypothetical protein